MIKAADGFPLNRRLLVVNTGVFSPAFLQLLRQTGYWYSGGKIAWVPNYDGTVHDILWARSDPNEPIPDWIRRVPYFVMANAILTTASVSPWTVDPTWNVTVNTVELIGSGGNGVQGGTGANSSGGGGGGGGAYTKLSNGAVTGTVAFHVGVGATGNTVANRSAWESDVTGGSPANYYFANSGGPASTASTGTTDATPAVTFTVTSNFAGGAFAGSGSNRGGGGGSGAGGPAAAGGAAGSTVTGNGGSGGGGANNGVPGVGGASSGTSVGGNGGTGSSGAGGSGGTTTGGNGTGNSGGEGSDGIATQTNLTGGNGGAGTDFDGTHGLGGGGGGSGQCTFNGTITSKGGDGALYGGAGGGTGGCRGTGSTRTIGTGAAGLIFLTWTVDTLRPGGWM